MRFEQFPEAARAARENRPMNSDEQRADRARRILAAHGHTAILFGERGATVTLANGSKWEFRGFTPGGMVRLWAIGGGASLTENPANVYIN